MSIRIERHESSRRFGLDDAIGVCDLGMLCAGLLCSRGLRAGVLRGRMLCGGLLHGRILCGGLLGG